MRSLVRILQEKSKNIRKVHLTIYLVVSIFYLVALSFFTHSLLLLQGIETLIRLIIISIFWILGVAYIIFGFLWLLDKKKKILVFTSFFLLFMAFLFIAGTYFIRVIYNEIDEFSKERRIYTTYLIALNDEKITNSDKLAMIDDKNDVEGNILAKKLIKKEKLKNEIVYYEDYYEMFDDLYNGEVKGLFIGASYDVLFANDDEYATIGADTYIVYKYSEERENQDLSIGTDKALTEPFSLLVMGLDTEIPGDLTANGDTLVLITFNPKTLSATMLSLPRDLYVPIACRNNAMAKINSSAGRGTSCVISTIEKLADIKIDYYVKLNFAGMVDLVDALGGIEVDVQKPYFNFNHGFDCKGMFCEQDSKRRWGEYTIFLEPGWQTLNGEEALAYSRNRAQYLDSDFARNRHQQQIIEAITKKATSIRDFDTLRSILTTLQKNMDTNLSPIKILSFYNVGKSILLEGGELVMQRTYLEVYNIPPSSLGYHQASLDEIISALKINLELKKPVLIKTFSYAYDENYEIRPYGKGLIGGDNKIETVPSFIGSSKANIESWCLQRGISVAYEEVSAGDALFDPFRADGYIISQSVPKGSLVKETKSITFYVIKNQPDTITCDPDDILCEA